MIAGILFVVATILPLFLLIIVYNIQNKVNNLRTTVFKLILLTVIYTSIFEIICTYLTAKGHYNTASFLIRTQWIAGTLDFFCLYIYNFLKVENCDDLTFKKLTKKHKEVYFIGIFTIIVCLFLLLFPILNYNTGEINYMHFPHSYISMGYGVVIIVLLLIRIIRKKTIDSNLKRILFFESLIGVAYSIFEPLLKDVALSPLFNSGVIFLIYMYLENPDIYITNDLDNIKKELLSTKNKNEYVSKSLNQELLTEINIINNKLNLYKEGKLSKEQFLELLDNLKFKIKSLNGETCNAISIILNEESDDVEVEISIDKYLKRFYRLTNKLITKDNIVYRMDVLESTPAKVLINTDDLFFSMLSLFKNALDNIEIGEIIMTIGGEQVSGKHYLTIKCNDTGRGFSKEELTELQSILTENTNSDKFDKNLIVVNKRRKIYGGELKVDSFEGAGTIVDMKLEYGAIDESRMPRKIIDNKITLEDDNVFDCERKRLLFLGNRNKTAKELFSIYNINIDEVQNGKELIDKLKQDNTYDWIFISLANPEALEVTKALKALNKSFGYNIPYVVGIVPYKTKKYRQIINSSSIINDYIIEPLELIDLNTGLNKIRRK